MAKFLSGRQSNLNLGITSYTESETVLQTIGKVGIGTTNAGNYSLYVVGDTNITSDVTARNYYGSGAYLTGISTFVNANILSGIFTNLYVSGISTLGVTSATNFTSQSLVVIGISTLGVTSATNLTTQSLVVSGVSTLGTVKISSGIITAVGLGTVVYYGDGSNLQGVNAFNVINQDINSSPVFPTFASNVGVSSVGISTTKLVFVPASGNLGLGTTNPTSKLHVVGDIKVSGVSTLGTVKISSGIISATVGVVTYYGDGSNLQGVNAFNVINQDINSTPVFPTFASNVGVSSVGISTTKLVFVPATGRLGIGTTSPQYSLDSIGDINSSTIVRAKGIDILEEVMRLAIALS